MSQSLTRAEQYENCDNLIELMAATFCVNGSVVSPEHYGPIKEQLYAELLGWGMYGIKVVK